MFSILHVCMHFFIAYQARITWRNWSYRCESTFFGYWAQVELTDDNRTYNPVGLIKVSHFSRGGRAPSRLPMKKLKSLLRKTRQVRLFVSKGILKITPYSLPCKQ